MKFYRLSSSAVTGRAPRSMSSAFGCAANDPVHPMPDRRAAGRRLSDAIAWTLNFARDAIGALFGR